MNSLRAFARIHLIAVSALIAVGSAIAAETSPASIRVSQVWQDGSAITAYLDVRDQEDRPVSELDAGQLHATLGVQVADISDLEPFAATDEGVLYLFLVDRSRSLFSARFAQLRAALTAWVAALQPPDRAGIITFGERVETPVAPTADRAALDTAIAGLAPSDNLTALHQGLVRGIEMGQQQVADWPQRRAMVILSDGLEDSPGGMTADEVHARLAENPVPIYAIGLSAAGSAERRAAGLAALGRFARESGGLYLDANRAEDLTATYAEMRAHIRAVWRLQLHCPECILDGNRYRLQVTLLSDDGLRLSDGADLRLLPPPIRTETPESMEDGGEADGAEPETDTDTDAETVAADLSSSGEPAPEDISADPDFIGGLDSHARWMLVAGGLAVLVLLIILAVALRARSRRHQFAHAAAATNPADTAMLAAASEDAGRADEPSLSLDAEALVTHAAARAAPIDTEPPLRLAFVTGPRRGEMVELPLMPSARLGRSADCALVLSGDDEISGRHAEIERLAKGQRVLRDLGSTNGTRLNGIGIQGTHPLQDGDRIGVGQTELRVLP